MTTRTKEIIEEAKPLRRDIVKILLDVRGDNEYPSDEVLQANASILYTRFESFLAQAIERVEKEVREEMIDLHKTYSKRSSAPLHGISFEQFVKAVKSGEQGLPKKLSSQEEDLVEGNIDKAMKSFGLEGEKEEKHHCVTPFAKHKRHKWVLIERGKRNTFRCVQCDLVQ